MVIALLKVTLYLIFKGLEKTSKVKPEIGRQRSEQHKVQKNIEEKKDKHFSSLIINHLLLLLGSSHHLQHYIQKYIFDIGNFRLGLDLEL